MILGSCNEWLWGPVMSGFGVLVSLVLGPVRNCFGFLLGMVLESC
jgi:hypothetical protein